MSVVRGRPPGLAGGMNGSSSRYWSSLSAWPDPKSPTSTRSSSVHIEASQPESPPRTPSPQSPSPRQADQHTLSKQALRLTYLTQGYKRKSLTSNIPFLQGYQGNACFYCGEPMAANDIHVDHVLPRQVVQHDEIWNLALAHSLCNGLKQDRLVGPHFIRKLIARNENITGSSHPWKARIALALGNTPQARSSTLTQHYEQVKLILGAGYWG